MQTQNLSGTGTEKSPGESVSWKEIVRKYQVPSKWKSAWQMTNTLVPFALLWVAMFFCLKISWWLVIPLAILAGGFIIRIFIIFHDCTHGSFFKSKKANDIVGFITGVLSFTPYQQWRWEHAVHHSSAGDLDRRGMGDVWTLTVQEYLESSRWRRFAYQISRNPFILFGVAPVLLFLVYQRVPNPKGTKAVRNGTHLTNLALLAMAALLSWAFGIVPYLIIQVIMLTVASSAGVWLFYVQHQFEDVYWERRPDWDYKKAALEGSSFYKLPKILQWFSGNIGYHHIHHLSPRIPNYELERAHREEPMFQEITPLTIRTSLKSFTFRLWDEENGKLTDYGPVKRARSAKKAERARSNQPIEET